MDMQSNKCSTLSALDEAGCVICSNNVIAPLGLGPCFTPVNKGAPGSSASAASTCRLMKDRSVASLSRIIWLKTFLELRIVVGFGVYQWLNSSVSLLVAFYVAVHYNTK